MKIPVLFPKIFDHPFTYESDIKEILKPGDFVKAPFGSSEITGVVWPHEEKTEKKFKIKKISRKINIEKLNSKMIDFINWFSKYNLVSLGMSLKMCLLNKEVVEKNYKEEFKFFTLIFFEIFFILNFFSVFCSYGQTTPVISLKPNVAFKKSPEFKDS